MAYSVQLVFYANAAFCERESLVDCTECTASFFIYTKGKLVSFSRTFYVYKQHKVSVVLRSEKSGWIGLCPPGMYIVHLQTKVRPPSYYLNVYKY